MTGRLGFALIVSRETVQDRPLQSAQYNTRNMVIALGDITPTFGGG